MNNKNSKKDKEETTVSKKEESSNKKVLIGLLIGVISVIIIGVIVYFIAFKTPASNTKTKLEENNEAKTSGNEFDISIEEQYKDVLKRYFYYDAIYVDEYDNLDRFPVAYKDVMITFYAYVKKVLEDDGTNFKILVYFVDNDYDGYENQNESNEMIIQGKYENGKRYLKDDLLDIYGIYKGMSSYTINGDKKVLPTIKTDKIVMKSGPNSKTLFDEKDLREVAKYFFNTENFTLVKPNYDYTNERELKLMELPFHYILKLDNNSNSKFSEYRMYANIGYIEVATEKESGTIKRYITKTSDNKNFILSSYTPGNNRLELQVYDDSFNKIWSNEYEKAENYRYYSNNGIIALNINNDTYFLSEKDGSNIIEPFMTGEALGLRLLSNGDCIFVSKKKSDFVMYIDKTGTIKWKTGLDVNPSRVSSIITANDKIYINYESEGTNDLVTSVYDKTGKLIVNTYES